MHRVFLVATLVAAAAGTAHAGPNIGVSIGINQPGVYGRIDVGNMPTPSVVYPQPVVIVPTPVAVYRQPIYLYVPPAHQARWGQYCKAYSACGQPVYFVRESWVREHRYRGDDDHDDERHERRGKHKGKRDRGDD